MDILLRRTRGFFTDVLCRAYADDLAIVVPDGLRRLPDLFCLMSEFALGSGLELNLHKTVIMPLQEESLEDLKSSVRELVPGWAAIPLRHAVKHLGFYLGPLKEDSSYKAPRVKYHQRLEVCGNTECGSMIAILAFKVYISAVLFFAARLENPPDT